MTYVASIDVGTTSVKGVLITRDGSLQGNAEVGIETLKQHQLIEQDPRDWWSAFKRIVRNWADLNFSLDKIEMITFSGQMQDCIPVDKHGDPVRHAILYSDSRAASQAEAIRSQAANIEEVTGNHFDGSMPFPKMKWLLEKEEDHFDNTACFLFSSKDFVIHHLTGALVTDLTTGATTGMMDLENREWSTGILEQGGMHSAKLPALCASDEVVGYIHQDASEQTGLKAGTPVLCGAGDAGATTMGAGLAASGDQYIYMGTTGWIATTTEQVQRTQHGLFHLTHLDPTLFIRVAPMTNVGNVHKWAVNTLTDSHLNKDDAYRQFEQMVSQTLPDSRGVLFLPYLNGERFPVHDPDAYGSFLRLSSAIDRSALARSVLEGISLSIRQSMELLAAGHQDKPVTLLGGGSRSQAWMQIAADVTGLAIDVPVRAEFLPTLGAVAPAFLRLGWADSYEAFATAILDTFPKKRFTPIEANANIYDKLYSDFKKVYEATKHI